MRIKILLILCLILFFVSGYLLGNNNKAINNPSKYKYVNKELGTNKKIIKKHEYIALKNTIHSYLNSEISLNKIDYVSVYFRDLHDGPTFGINEHEEFVPASLLKVPVMIAYLSIADENRLILSRSLKAVNSDEFMPLVQRVRASKTIEDNKPYTIEELIRAMIIYSDNKAYDVLVTYMNTKISPTLFLEVFREIGIVDPQSVLDQTMSVKSYASLFRQLYNGSYLSLEMSEKALEILTQSEFKNGLAAHLPKNIKVANKFGEREIIGQESIQLHDCGIIYFPDNPYLLCVMTRGIDLDNNISVIQQISKMVYEEVESRRLN